MAYILNKSNRVLHLFIIQKLYKSNNLQPKLYKILIEQKKGNYITQYCTLYTIFY